LSEDGALRHKAILKIHDAIEHCKRRYGFEMPYPDIKFDLKGRTAGIASSAKNSIRLNMSMLSQNGEKFLERTPVHEAAHLIVRKLHGCRKTAKGRRVVKPHGPEWEAVMRELGLEPSRCHTYATNACGVRKRSKGKKYSYKCQCRSFDLGAIRHKRSLKGAAYRCKTCKKPLVYQGA
jgi:SprT protein